MAREPIEITISDVSQFAKQLRGRLDVGVGHQSMLNAVAQAAGYQNFQHLKARSTPHSFPAAPEAAQFDRKTVERVLACFDWRGRLSILPQRFKLKTLCIWAIWSQLPDRVSMNEREISARIDTLCTIRDAAFLRRGLVDHGLMTRRPDGTDYRRIGRKPGPEARAVMSALRERRRRSAATS